MKRTIPAGFTPELQSLARIIFGFLIFRHGMEQVFGFPGAYRDVASASAFGVLKLLCFPGGLLMMLGLFTRPAALVLSAAHLLYWFVEPLPDAVLQGRRLFGAGGAPSDHILLPGFFFLYLSLTGPGAWSLDRLLGRDAGSGDADPRSRQYSLGALRIVTGFLFIFHGIREVRRPGRCRSDVASRPRGLPGVWRRSDC